MNNTFDASHMWRLYTRNKEKRWTAVVLFIKHNSAIIYAVIFIAAFCLGIINSPIKSRNISLENISVNNHSFLRILINNLLLGISLLLGFIFFNIYNAVAVFINGLMWGFYLNKFFANLGMLNTLILFVPHGLLEFYWIIGISGYSTLLCFDFYNFLNTGYKNRRLLKSLCSTKVLKLFLFILFSAFFESYITGYIFNSLN